MVPRLVRLACLASLVWLPFASACTPRGGSDTVTIPALVPPPVRPSAAASAAPTHRPQDPGVKEPRNGRAPGTPILVEWHGRYYEATVLSTTPDGLTRIHYEGYGPEWDEDVGEERIRERPEDGSEILDEPGFD